MGWLTAAAITANVLGNVVGNIASAGDRAKAEKAQQEAADLIAKLGAGPDLSKQIYLEKFKSAGVLTPDVEKAIDMQVSKVAQIKEDPAFKKAQMGALEALQARGKTGLTAEERVQLLQERRSAEKAAESKRQQIMAEMRARGALDSGAGLRAQMQSADELASRELESSERLAAGASQRALQALVQSGQMAGSVRGQEFDIARTLAGAEDEMARFNITNQRGIEQRRASQETAARQYNLAQQQRAMDMNIQQANQERIRQMQAQQQMYQNQLAIAQMQQQALLGQAAQNRADAAQTQQAFSQAGQAIGQGLNAWDQWNQGADLRNLQQSYLKAGAGYYDKMASSFASPSASSTIPYGFFPYGVK